MKIFLALGSIAIVLIGFVGWYRWDSSQNRGREFGYYGDFNRVSNALVAIPGVVITQGWHNADITLEEFGFSLTVSGQSVYLPFAESDTIRNLKRDAAVPFLKQRINAALALSETNR